MIVQKLLNPYFWEISPVSLIFVNILWCLAKCQGCGIVEEFVIRRRKEENRILSVYLSKSSSRIS